jgi:hypothetical protein
MARIALPALVLMWFIVNYGFVALWILVFLMTLCACTHFTQRHRAVSGKGSVLRTLPR